MPTAASQYNHDHAKVKDSLSQTHFITSIYRRIELRFRRMMCSSRNRNVSNGGHWQSIQTIADGRHTAYDNEEYSEEEYESEDDEDL